MKISLTEPTFIHGEACAVTGASSKVLNNWIQRGVVDLGKMQRHGRRQYSIIDLIKLKVVVDLAHTVKMGPAFSAAVAESVLPRVTEILSIDSKGRLIARDYSADDIQVLVAWSEPDRDNFTVKRIKIGSLSDVALQTPHPMIVIPIDEISLRIARAAEALLAEDDK